MTSSVNGISGQNIKFEQKRPIKPDEFIDYYNACKDVLEKMITSQINKISDIKDSDGNLYKFSRTRDGPKVIRDYAKHITKMDLSERITIVETRLKEIDFLAQRIRDLEELVMKTFKLNQSQTHNDLHVSEEKIRKGSGASGSDRRRKANTAENDVSESICDKVQDEINVPETGGRSTQCCSGKGE